MAKSMLVTPEEQAAGRRERQAQVRKIRNTDAPEVLVTRCCGDGPRCTVLTEDGLIIHGHRVRDDYVGCTSIVVFRGWCVSAVWVDAVHGTELTTPEGRLKISPAEPPELVEAVRHPYPELVPWERIQHRYKRVPV